MWRQEDQVGIPRYTWIYHETEAKLSYMRAALKSLKTAVCFKKMQFLVLFDNSLLLLNILLHSLLKIILF